ncbi:MAG: hypothetical protein LBV22_03015, partial [Mycoplasmataceae bacterium]|nr:hypothetical protein [Mycoplasmataceae bacterium]
MSYFFVSGFLNTIIGLILYNRIYQKDLLISRQFSGKFDHANPTVAIVIPVFNDFCLESTIATFNQTYRNCKYYILDDSTDMNMCKTI